MKAKPEFKSGGDRLDVRLNIKLILNIYYFPKYHPVKCTRYMTCLIIIYYYYHILYMFKQKMI